jgi:exocyst complex component 4
MTNGSDDAEYEKARQQELEDEKRRQQRIRERAPGRKATGRANAGDVDGMSSAAFLINL